MGTILLHFVNVTVEAQAQKFISKWKYA